MKAPVLDPGAFRDSASGQAGPVSHEARGTANFSAVAQGLVSASLRFATCGLCRRLFFLCTRCDRGRLYCGEVCSDEARQRALRAARSRHQRSPEGRLDHRDRQREYRERCRLRVMDTGSEKLASGATVRVRADALPSCDVAVAGPQESLDARAGDDDRRDAAADEGAARALPRRDGFDGAVRCRFCGARGHLVRAGFLRRPRRAPPLRATRAPPAELR